MDKREARSILEWRIAELRRESYASLVAKWLRQPDAEQISGESGVGYQVEIEAIWDDPREEGGNLRVLASIDDGGWRAMLPLTDDFIIAPDGSFIGE
jgi:hypothetical protein